MTPSSRLSAFCDKIIEVGWLAAVVLAPLFFNVYSSRVFEPDKLTMVRSIALVMIGAWLVKMIEERGTAQLERIAPLRRSSLGSRSPTLHLQTPMNDVAAAIPK